ncbi:Fe2+-dependent dioxygenase [Pelagicoccus sp. SDUM812005]|uniref:Fe2+-dependent dioxygenase n=1 Tax=Pelagicoccus sp. SDUM812005 TaxID=3041257 RepID=UPI00280EE0F5|nr:Fe2+-dependent dioxygenase [Pelagicoccus sp. SDUM812005]MDQ8181198.1 Fe2+-dependent dioxygenase [Pelagicoccus sp. SDUM812005]
MLISIPNLLTPEQVTHSRRILEAANWVDGKASAGHQGAKVKDNAQLLPEDPAAQQVGDLILRALGSNPLFMSAAMPLHILPPMFNSYSGGQTFGTHVDGSIRVIPGTQKQIRTDLSCTLFFAEPHEYEGGELCIEDTYGTQRVKLPAGHAILYPSTSLHHVTPVTKGTRLCSFFWIQSMLRDDTQRSLLFDMDLAIQRLGADHPEHPSNVQLTGVYHNLLRQWAEM